MEEDLPVDVFRRIAGFSTNSKTILDLWSLNDASKLEISREIEKLAKKGPVRVDLRRFFRENNPFLTEFYEFGDSKQKKRFHDAIRELTRLLERLLKISTNFQIDNLNASAVGFLAENDEKYMDRAPFMLQKKLMHVLEQFQSREIAISMAFMRPSRQIRTFRHRLDTITSLDLGSMKPHASCKLRSSIFPGLKNLQKLKWDQANHRMMHKLPKTLSSLDVTFHVVGGAEWREFEFLTEFEHLEHFYCGFTVPEKPTRFYMDVVLNLYQSMWKLKFPNNRRMLESFPNIRELGLWNSPEKIFNQISLKKMHIETLNFGAISQSLSKLCSFDSILQSFFKFDEADGALLSPSIHNLNMNLHAMPAIGLDYYLPQLMDHVNRMTNLKRVSLFFKCIFHSQMTESWSLEGNKERRRRPMLLSSYTHFQMHSEGLCGLKDLDRQLPVSLESCSISLNLPPENAPKVLESILEFIRKLGDVNNFPELRELHIQVMGVKCFELLVHTIHESIGAHLHSLSILAPPTLTDKQAARALFAQLGEFFPNVRKINISIEFLSILLKESWRNSAGWKEKLRKLGRIYNFQMDKLIMKTSRALLNEHDELMFGAFLPKGEEPVDYDKEDEEEGEESGEEEDVEDEEEELMESTIVYESEVDELELLEQKLTKESEKRHKKWEKKRKMVVLEDSDEEEGQKTSEADDDEDVVDWNQLDEQEEEEEPRERHGFLNDEAEEGEESDNSDEQEPEGEDLVDSDDDRLFMNGPSRKRKNQQEQKSAKRRKIVVSDDEDE